MYALYCRRQVDNRCYGRLIVLNRIAFKILINIDICFDGDVALDCGTARQNLAIITLAVHQRERRGFAHIHITVNYLNFAGCTRSVPAGKRQPHTLAQRRLQNSLTFFHFNLFANWLNGNGIAHRSALRMQNPGYHPGLVWLRSACSCGRPHCRLKSQQRPV